MNGSSLKPGFMAAGPPCITTSVVIHIKPRIGFTFRAGRLGSSFIYSPWWGQSLL